MNKLSRLRLYFIIYMVVKTVVDVTLIGFNGDLIRDINFYGLGNFSLSQGSIFILVCLVDVILFALGLWIFHFLLRKRMWARIVLLIIGWFTVLDALSGLLLHSETVRVLSRMFGTTDWNRLILIDHLTDILGCIYFVYLIIILQFTGDVKQIFVPPPEGKSQT